MTGQELLAEFDAHRIVMDDLANRICHAINNGGCPDAELAAMEDEWDAQLAKADALIVRAQGIVSPAYAEAEAEDAREFNYDRKGPGASW